MSNAARDAAIELMRSGNYQAALKRFNELDSDMAPAYNSLAITQKKMGKLSLALHNHEEGLKALSRSIVRGMRNIEENKIYPHPNVRGTRWVQYAMNAAIYLCAIQGDIGKLAWPRGDQAMAETESQAHRGLYWRDTTDTEGVKTRLFLPNFFNTFFSVLRSDAVYATMLGNFGSVLEMQGNKDEAELCYQEANEFMTQ